MASGLPATLAAGRSANESWESAGASERLQKNLALESAALSRRTPLAVIRARPLFDRLAPTSRHVRGDEMEFYL
jgi:hypothetical protein